MKLTGDEARDIVWEDHEDWEQIEAYPTGSGRWSIWQEGIFLHKPTGKYYQFNWSFGATEQQDESPFEYEEEVEPVEVVQVEKVVKVWEAV